MPQSVRFAVVASLVSVLCAARPAPDAPASAARLSTARRGRSVATQLSASLTFYTDRASFQASAPGLSTEDFEAGQVADGGIMACPGPLDASSSNACFSSGAILPGVSFNSTAAHNGTELALMGAGFLNAPSKVLTAAWLQDGFVIDFPDGNVKAAGADLVSYRDPDTCTIEVFGTSGSLGTTTAPCTPEGTFWGVISDQVITRITILAPMGTAEGVDNLSFGAGGVATPSVTTVVLDIKPGTDVNPINLTSEGLIPVAVLSTPDFDATQIDVSSLTFGPGGAPDAHGRGNPADLNGDGRTDLLLHFATQAAGIGCGDTQATLKGKTLSGAAFQGTDKVTIVKCAR
jgi:hypothetical protein